MKRDQAARGNLPRFLLQMHVERTLLRNPKARLIPKTKQPPWRFPAAIEKRYTLFISRLMREYTIPGTFVSRENMVDWKAEYNLSVARDSVDRVDAWDDEVRALINRLRGTQDEMFVVGEQDLLNEILLFGIAVSVFNKRQFANQIKWITKEPINIETIPDEAWLPSTLNAWADENFNLIKGLSDDYIKNLNRIISDGVVNTGVSAATVVKDIRALGEDISKRRAKLIATDQIQKLNGRLTQSRQQDAGIDMYIWLTSQDERVVGTPGGKFPRATAQHGNHFAMHNTVNKWNDASVVSFDGGRTFQKRATNMQGAIPGSQLACRCTSSPLLDPVIDELEQEARRTLPVLVE